MDHSQSTQRCAAALILAALCVLATAQALAPEKDGRSRAINFRFRRASQTTSAKAYDNAAFIKELKALDSEKSKGYKLRRLQRHCYSAYQPGKVPSNFIEYGKEYLKEFDAVKNDLSAVYRIRAWDHKKEKDLGEVAKLVTGYVSDDDNEPCPNGFVKNKCAVFKKKGHDYELDRELDCKDFTDESALSNFGKVLWKDDPNNNDMCISKRADYDAFMKFSPKGSVPKSDLCKKKKARLSLSLKKTGHNERPKALFGIVKTLLLDKDVKAVLKYAKIETMKARQDSILMQVCYDPADDGVNKVKNLAKTLTQTLSSYSADLSDDGPYFQEKVDAFFVADYTHGSSWGSDVCCLWAGLADTDQLILALKLYESPIYGYEMAGDAYPQLMQTRDKKNKCKLHFKHKNLTLTGSSTKADFKKKK